MNKTIWIIILIVLIIVVGWLYGSSSKFDLSDAEDLFQDLGAFSTKASVRGYPGTNDTSTVCDDGSRHWEQSGGLGEIRMSQSQFDLEPVFNENEVMDVVRGAISILESNSWTLCHQTDLGLDLSQKPVGKISYVKNGKLILLSWGLNPNIEEGIFISVTFEYDE